MLGGTGMVKTLAMQFRLPVRIGETPAVYRPPMGFSALIFNPQSSILNPPALFTEHS
jgi:hypothetical protein